MEKIMSFLKNGLPELTFAAFALRIVVMGSSIGDALALMSMVAIFGYFRFLERNKVDQYAELKQEIEALRNSMTSVKLQQGLSNRGVPKNETHNNATKRYF